MSTPETVVAALIDSFNKTDKDLFLSLGAPGATSWVSGVVGKMPSAGERAYADHHYFAPNVQDAPNKLDDVFMTVTGIVVDQGGKKVAVEAVVTGAGVGEQTGKTLTFSFVMMIELDADCKIVKLREFLDYSTLLDFYGKLKL